MIFFPVNVNVAVTMATDIQVMFTLYNTSTPHATCSALSEGFKLTAQSDFFFFPVIVAVTTATDILVMVKLYNTSPPPCVTCSALALAAADTDL